MAFLLSAALTYLYASQSGQIGGGTVSFESLGQPARRVIAELGATMNAPLSVSALVSPEVLAISVHDVSSKELLDRIAGALNATWKASGNGLVLTRTPDQIKEEERNVQRTLEEEAERRYVSFEERRRQLLQAQPLSEDEIGKSIQAIYHSSGAENINKANDATKQVTDRTTVFQQVLRVFDCFSARDLFMTPSGNERIYSTRPNSSELPLSPKALDIGNAVIREVMGMSSTYERFGFKDLTQRSFGSASLNPLAPVRNLVPLDRVLVAANSNSFRMLLVDKEGQQIWSYDNQIESMVNTPFPTFTPPPTDVDDDKTITLPADLFALASELYIHRRKPVKIPNIINRFLTPESVEPLSVVAGPILGEVAKSLHVQLVAVIPDDSLDGDVPDDNGFTWKTYKRNLGGCVVEKKEGWLTIRPYSPVASRARQLDRQKLGALLRYLHNSPRFDLIDYARLIVDFPEFAPHLEATLSAFAVGGPSFDYMFDRRLVRFVGTLNPNQIAQATTRQGLRVGELTPRQFERFLAVIGRSGSGIFPSQKGPHTQEEATLANRDREKYFMGALSYTAELFPRGIPQDSILRILIEDSEVVAEGNPNEMMRNTFNVDYLAKSILNPDLQVLNDRRLQELKLQLAQNSQLSLSVDFGKVGTLNKNTSAIRATGPMVPFDQLPQSFLNRIKQRAEELKKTPGGALPPGVFIIQSTGSPTTKPPTR